MELGQSFIPGREMSALDLFANGIGIAVGCWASLRLTNTFDNPNKAPSYSHE